MYNILYSSSYVHYVFSYLATISFSLSLQIVFGLHVRGSLVVSIMTWFSLYVGWGSYMNIGMDNNYCM